MAHLLKVVLILGFLTISVGCGQKGNLYMPSEQAAKYQGL